MTDDPPEVDDETHGIHRRHDSWKRSMTDDPPEVDDETYEVHRRLESWKRSLDTAVAKGEMLARAVDRKLRQMERPQSQQEPRVPVPAPTVPEQQLGERDVVEFSLDVLRTRAWRTVVEVTEAVVAWRSRTRPMPVPVVRINAAPPPGYESSPPCLVAPASTLIPVASELQFKLRLIDEGGVPLEAQIGFLDGPETRWRLSIVGEFGTTCPEGMASDLSLRELVAVIQRARAVEIPVYTPGQAGGVDEPSAPSEGTKPQAKSPADGGK